MRRRLFRILVFGGIGMWLSFACSIQRPIWWLSDPTADPLFRFSDGDKFGYIDPTGRVVIPAEFKLSALERDNFGGEFHEGLLALGMAPTRFIDRSGRQAITEEFGWAFSFSEGLAPAIPGEDWVKRLAGRKRRSKVGWGFIDHSGNFVIPPRFSRTPSPFSEGLARVEMDREDEVGYIDHSGKFVIPPTLTSGSDFHDGLAVAVVDRPCSLLNGGSCDIAAEFAPMKRRGRANARACEYAVIDRTGAPISADRFQAALHFSEGLAAVKIGGSWGYVDRTAKIVIKPAFETAAPFSDGFALVSQAKKFGYIDQSGSVVIPLQFRFAESFSEGLAAVWMDSLGGWRYIDHSGQPAFAGTFALAEEYRHGLATVVANYGAKTSMTVCYLDKKGNKVFCFTQTPR